jgi:hypothetical protein
LSDATRSGLLVAELERDLGWKRGTPVPVTLRLPDHASARADLQLGFLAAAQLLGRMVGTVERLGLVAPTLASGGAALLGATVQLDAGAADAVGAAGLVPTIVGSQRSGITISVGHDPSADLWFDALGWVALINQDEPGDMAPGAPLGAIVGACLTANELFALVHSTAPTRRVLRFSAWDSSGNGGPALELAGRELGEFDLAGAGAVGQTALWTLAAAELRAQVCCADPDVVDPTNLERLPFCGAGDIGRPKIEAVGRGLASTSVAFTGQTDRYELARRTGTVPLLSAVDDDTAREALQQTAPPVLLSGTTGGLAASIEWHDLDPAFACLACGHPIQPGPSVEELAERLGIPVAELRGAFTASRLAALEQRWQLAAGALDSLRERDVCGHLNEVARIALGIGSPAGSVGFLSWLAGALLAVELIAHRAGDGTHRPRFRMVTLVRPGHTTSRSRRPRPTCSCQSDFFAGFYADRRAGFTAVLAGPQP